MGQVQRLAEEHGQRLKRARELFFAQGELPDGLVDPVILRSWERCRRYGLDETGFFRSSDGLDRIALKTEQERNRAMIRYSRPIMEHVYEQIRESNSMVILADASGLLLDTVGDPDFVTRAQRIALSCGASWDENNVGTNAIGTVLAEEAPTAIFGSEHFLDQNGFLTCCASPIFGPDGRLLGVFDISGDYRNPQRHTLGLARLSAAIVEKRLFESTYGAGLLVCFHPDADYLGSPKEGIAAISQDGQILAINRIGLKILGIRHIDAVRRDFSMVFENNLATLVDRLRHTPMAHAFIRTGGQDLCLQLRGQLPPAMVAGRIFEAQPKSQPNRALQRDSLKPLAPSPITLDSLNTGDPRMQAAIDRARRILGKDIPMLIQGESGVGKEMLAKGFHRSGPRANGPFVALNCASIPETLIESELFGYLGGAFTGARKEGAPGKIQQAHGGTLFLDEIGDMPLNLQARLLRVLQERSVTPLGSTQSLQVDISLICATHRTLREEVACGRFREDLYYRLNGLSVTLPPLRERTDIRILVAQLAAGESANRPVPVTFSESALQVMENYGWPGNIRQLFNAIRVAIALLDDHESVITEHHLPEELLELPNTARAPIPGIQAVAFDQSISAGRLDDISRQMAQRALDNAGGNISAAARTLGISRNTLYRKLGRSVGKSL